MAEPSMFVQTKKPSRTPPAQLQKEVDTSIPPNIIHNIIISILNLNPKIFIVIIKKYR